MGSTRLPGKTLRLLGERPLIWYVLERLRKIKEADEVVILTSDTQADDVLANWCHENQVSCFRGSEDDVLKRYYRAAVHYSADQIVRATGDNPFVDFDSASKLLSKHIELGAEYSSNKSEIGSALPDGLGVEIFSFSALKRSAEMSTEPHHFEHVNEYILENKSAFKIYKDAMAGGLYDRSYVRLTVDTVEDFTKAEFIAGASTFSLDISTKELINLETQYSN